MNRGKLYVMSGPSGAGKGTICRELLSEAGKTMVCSVSMTTRAPREGEKDGVNYFFVTKDEFREEIENDGLLEYATVFDNYYGTPKKAVMDNLERGTDVLLEIDVQGALQVKKAFQEAVLIFIMPPSFDELRNRITGRGTETEERIERRLSEAAGEVKQAVSYDYIVVNDNLEKAVSDVQAAVRAEHLKKNEQMYLIDEFM